MYKVCANGSQIFVNMYLSVIGKYDENAKE